MQKIVTVAAIVTLLSLLIVGGGCSRLSSAEQKELDKITRYVGRNISDTDRHGNTSLHHAAMYGSPGVVRYLVAEGSKLDTRNAIDDTPLYCAVFSNKNLEVIEFLFSQQGGDVNDARNITLLHRAAHNDNAEVIKFIASKGQEGNVNARDAEGNTPLHWAADSYNVETAKFLVSLGANVKISNKQGYTPLALARRNLEEKGGNKAIVEYLSGIR